jgi:hypothetical protein
MTSISIKYKISTTKLKDICTKNNIPIPPLGHWQRIKLGQKVDIPELPPNNSEAESTAMRLSSPENTTRSKIDMFKAEIEKDCKVFLNVPSRLVDPDKYIVAIKDSLEGNNRYPYGHEKFIESPISVTQKNIGRLLRILDTFIKLAKARNHLIETRNRSIRIFIETEEYVFTIREKQKRIESKDKWHAFDYEYTGLLVMGVGKSYDKKEFIDGSQPLEKQLSKVLAYLEYLADYWKQIHIKNDLDRKEREEREKRMQEIRDREERKQKKFDKLLHDANKWHQAKILREFITEVE